MIYSRNNISFNEKLFVRFVKKKLSQFQARKRLSFFKDLFYRFLKLFHNSHVQLPRVDVQLLLLCKPVDIVTVLISCSEKSYYNPTFLFLINMYNRNYIGQNSQK